MNENNNYDLKIHCYRYRYGFMYRSISYIVCFIIIRTKKDKICRMIGKYVTNLNGQIICTDTNKNHIIK